MKHTNLFLLIIATCLTYSCNSKSENSHTKKVADNVQDESDNVAKKIANSPTYHLLDSLQAEMNIECRMAYNKYLINRSENNFAAILSIYQSAIPFPEKREKLKKSGLDLPQKLEKIASDIQKTSTSLAEEFPILTQPNGAEVIKKVMTIKPQSGLDNPLHTKL